MADNLKAKKKSFKLNYASTIYLQVIGSGAPGAPRSLYVFTEHCRYLFNCGEGTQRLASEHKIKLSMTEHIFITHKSWENVGGLLGALLTLQDAGVSEIAIHGPPNIETFIKDTKHFSQFTNLKVNYCHYERNSNVIEKGPIYIRAITLNTPPLEINHPIALGEQIINGSTHAREETCTGADLEEQINSDSTRDLALAYICRTAPKPGALLAHRCRELGVPLGPLMGELKKGNNVTLHNGNIVKAEDVTEPPDKGMIFIVVDIPTKSHLRALANSEEFSKYQELNASTPEDIADVVIHFTPYAITEELLYQQWITDFGSSTSHIYINEKNKCMGSESVHRVQYKLNHIYPESFPLLSDFEYILKSEPNADYFRASKRQKTDFKEDINENKELGSLEDNSNESEELSRNNDYDSQSFTCLTYHIRPYLKLDLSRRVQLYLDEYMKECYSIKDFANIYKKARCDIEKSRMALSSDMKNQIYPYILFLGTGSCIPNKTRNTSGIALFINSSCTMLLDCGEGTYGQLLRHLGATSAAEFLKHLSIIYISHLHADHHIGLIRILLARKRILESASEGNQDSKLKLLAPKRIIHYLNSYDNYFERISNQFTLVSNDLFLNFDNAEETEMAKFLANLGIDFIKTCYVHHCLHSFGIAITLKNKLKFTYSGDTMPCQALIAIGENCDLLIHEATMEDDLIEDAKVKRHSTTSQAIDVGNQMKAKHIVLTHFSQRYAKVPLLDMVPHNVVIAFDNMVIHFYDLPCLSHLYPAYKSIFSEDIDEILKKKAKRNA